MGGSALREFQAVKLKRYTSNEYALLVGEVESKMRAALPGFSVHAIPAYRRKADYGDLDLLVEVPNMEDAAQFRVHAAIREQFRPVVVIHQNNNRAISFSYRSFQIDAIMATTEEYEFSYMYYGYNDLGNLIGRVADAMGFKFGHDGLRYRFYDGEPNAQKTNMVAELFVTRDTQKALSFLGFDPERYRLGFEDMKDIFEYVVQGRYFNKEIFLLENRNYKARVRDSKRRTYTSFLWYLRNVAGKSGSLMNYDFPKDRSGWLKMAFELFPEFASAHSALSADLKKTKAIKSRFNGRIVQEATGLSGESLGAFMDWVRNGWIGNPAEKDEFERMVLVDQADQGVIVEWLRGKFGAYQTIGS